jgi:hypothetical protein
VLSPSAWPTSWETIERRAPAPLTLRQVDPLIRQLTHYRDVIARKTQEAIP